LSPRAPPNDYHDLCTMVGTFAALLFTLFGVGCELFLAVFHLYKTLISNQVVDIRGCFAPLYCKQITWAILEEARTFFGTQLHPHVLAPGYDGIITWPSCLLHKVCDDVIFGLPVIRQTFPMAWSELKPLAQKQTKQHQLQLLPAPLAAQPHTPNPFAVGGRQQMQPVPPEAYNHVHPRI